MIRLIKATAECTPGRLTGKTREISSNTQREDHRLEIVLALQ